MSAVTATVLLVSSCLCMVPAAQADELTELEEKVESTALAYEEAVDKIETLNTRIEENQAKIETLRQDIEDQREASNEAVRSLYIYQQSAPSLVNILLSSENITQLFETMEYLNRYEQYNRDILNEQKKMKDELESATEQLESDRAEAEQAAVDAEEALAEAKEARQEAMDRAVAEAQAQAEAEQAALEAAAAQDSDTSQQASTSVSSSDVNWSLDYDAFISEWTARIDAYLAGSPLAGQGVNFAKAAWTYGVDPRWSPAISSIESSKGANCFRSYNAWGWGTSSWSSWEEAIDAHVSGLARVYGSTLTLSAAQKYCPSNYQSWYSKVLAQMNMI